MKYGVKLEKELMTELWSGPIKDNPVNFVKYVFPWGRKDTPLEDFKGPVSYTHLRAHETVLDLVCRLLL